MALSACTSATRIRRINALGEKATQFLHSGKPHGVSDGQGRTQPGLVIFRCTDARHRNWHCRIKIPKSDR
jgi:hypothetical protein